MTELWDQPDNAELRKTITRCPFCGGKRPWFYQRFRIECERCGANTNGPEATTEEEAIAWWNELPRPPAAELDAMHATWKRRQDVSRQREARANKARKRKDHWEASERQKLDAEYTQWARDREAWLRAPIPQEVNND